jgi:flagellar hook-length control protein FliK
MLKGGENVSNINLNTSSGAVALVSPDNSVSNSTDSSNECSFNNVLASKTNGNSGANANSQSNAVSQSNNNNLQTNTAVNDTSDEDYTAALQKVKSEIEKLEDGSGNLDDGTTAALLLSLQQILNAILKNANTSTSTPANVSTSTSANALTNASANALTSASANVLTSVSANALTSASASALTSALASQLTNTATNVTNNNQISGNSGSIDLNSQLTQIENILQEISKDLVSSGKVSNGQISSNSFSQNGLHELNLSDDLTQITKDFSSLVQTQQNQTSSNNISNNVNSNLETKLSDIVECLNLTNQVLNSSNLSSSTMKNSDSSLFGKLRSVINSTINELKNNSNSASTSTENDPSYVSTNAYTSNTTMNNSDLSSSTSDKNSSSKDNEFLNNLISSNGNNGNSDNNYSKVTNVINQFINSNASTSKPVENQLPETQIRSANFAEDVITNVKYMQNNNIKDMTVTIAPKELGQVLINVSSENGVMKASITATNKEAYNLLNSNLGEINKNLSSQAVGLDNVEVNIYNGDTTFFKDGSNSDADTNQQQQKNKISNVFGIENGDDSELGDLTNMYEDNNVNALA